MVDVELIIVNVEAVSFDMMKALRQIVQHHALPIVIFAQREGVVRSSDVVKLGICAYIIDGLSVERIKPILEVAQARFEQFRLLQDEILASKQALSERKDIERAKGILMRQRNFSEDEAYNTLRKTAMSQNKRLADVARSIISVADMFG
ncbi:MAG: ANTAR domain-containing protein [Gammaproteobacteria bacterium]|nr:ANTAR domain-containing protein [Gammaproteobacteria bacterium]